MANTRTKLNVGLIGLGRLGRIYARDLATRIPCTRLTAVADVDAAAVVECKAAVPGEVVGVRVRLEHAREPDFLVRGLVEVLLDRVRGIDDHGFTGVLVADQVRRAAEAVVDELAEDHKP